MFTHICNHDFVIGKFWPLVDVNFETSIFNLVEEMDIWVTETK